MLRFANARRQLPALGLIALTLPRVSPAALPSAQPPTRGEGTNIMQTMQNYAYDGFLLFGLLVCVAVLVGVAWHVFGVYHEVQLGKKRWADLGATAGIGVAIIALVIFLVTKATGIL